MSAQYVYVYLRDGEIRVKPRRVRKRGQVHFIVRNQSGVTRDVFFVDTTVPAGELHEDIVASSAVLDSAAGNSDLTFTAKAIGTLGDGLVISTSDGNTDPASVDVGVGTLDVTICTSPTSNTQSSAVLDSVAANADLTFTAVQAGTAGDGIQIRTLDGVAVPLSIAVVGRVITLTVATSVSPTTANAVKTLVDATPAAAALVTVAVQGTGAGAVDAALNQTTAGGVNAILVSTANSVKALIEADILANALVSVAVQGTGAGVVDDGLSETTAGGADGSIDTAEDEGSVGTVSLAAGERTTIKVNTAAVQNDHLSLVSDNNAQFDSGDHYDLDLR